MLTRIHVNQHHIKANRKDGANRPVISAKTHRGNQYGHEVVISGPCRVIYSPDKPLSCGATVWIETEGPVDVIHADRSNHPVEGRRN